MTQIYKVFKETKPLILHNIPLYLSDEKNYIYIKIETPEDCQLILNVFWDFSNLNGISVYCPDLELFWKDFKSRFEFVKAAGGIVSDSEENILVIKRNGFFDLAKGHLENNETASEAAIREVVEECGISAPAITDNSPLLTYHVYEDDGKKILKETQWFKMLATSKQTPVPQLEEGIEQALWMPKSDLRQKIKDFYPSLFDLLGEVSQ